MIEASDRLDTTGDMDIQASIGMPVFTGEDYILEALDSLLDQTMPDFELIISDNASTDSTEEICRDYALKDTRIRYVRQEKNIGPAANFRFLLQEARGEYFMWAAADDTWGSRYLEKCIELLDEDERAAMATMAYVCNSRLSSIFNRKFNNPLECITIENTFDRVKSFSSLHASTHKDNLVYSVWRRGKLAQVVTDLDSMGMSNLLGGVMNEYALALFIGKYTPEVGFFKSYRYLPPGHILEPIFYWLSCIRRFSFRRVASGGSAYKRSHHLRDLRRVLLASGLSEVCVLEIAELDRTRSG